MALGHYTFALLVEHPISVFNKRSKSPDRQGGPRAIGVGLGYKFQTTVEKSKHLCLEAAATAATKTSSGPFAIAIGVAPSYELQAIVEFHNGEFLDVRVWTLYRVVVHLRSHLS